MWDKACMDWVWLNYGGWTWHFWDGTFSDYNAWEYMTLVCRIVVESA